MERDSAVDAGACISSPPAPVKSSEKTRNARPNKPAPMPSMTTVARPVKASTNAPVIKRKPNARKMWPPVFPRRVPLPKQKPTPRKSEALTSAPQTSTPLPRSLNPTNPSRFRNHRPKTQPDTPKVRSTAFRTPNLDTPAQVTESYEPVSIQESRPKNLIHAVK